MWRISTFRASLLVASLALAAPAAAQAGDDVTCRNGLFADQAPFALAKVVGEGRAHFYRDMDGCPVEGTYCREASYLVAGDEAIVSKLRGEFACVFYFESSTAGWMKLDRLELQKADVEPATGAWVGSWQDSFETDDIRIERDANGRLSVKGTAFWPGRPDTTDWPSIHVGEIDGPLRRFGNRARYDDDNLCEVNFTLLGNYLIAGDNRNCGGANVSFSSVYRRVR